MVRRMVDGTSAGEIEATVDGLFATRAARRVRRLFGEFYVAFPDWREGILEFAAEGDTAAGRFLCSGTHLGEFLGEAPTARRMHVEEVFFLCAEDGRFVDFWGPGGQHLEDTTSGPASTTGWPNLVAFPSSVWSRNVRRVAPSHACSRNGRKSDGSSPKPGG